MTGSSDIRWAAAAYVAFLEALTPESLPGLKDFCAPEVAFRDPFNDVAGIDALEAVFRKMFEDVAEPHFKVKDYALSGRTAYLCWDFTFRARGRAWSIDGMSEVTFDDEGKVLRHIDHWDAASQFYETVPFLGTLIRLIKRRLTAATRA